MDIVFSKMHGIGNDVVVIDARAQSVKIDSAVAERIAHRHYGVGCDQIMVIREAENADIGLAIFNNDGSPAGACGNGTRCVADLLLAKDSTETLTIAAPDGIITAWRENDTNAIAVDMGAPKTGWQEIPLSTEADTLALDLGESGLPPAVAVNMGNPHAVYFVEDAETIDVAATGARLENHALFPDGANIEFASPNGENRIRMRVWERGVGETIACGSGACATLVAAVQKSLIKNCRAEIILDGGSLDIEWREADGHVIMRGPSAFVFSGKMKL